MADKKKASSEKTVVTRIQATDTTPRTKTPKAAKKDPSKAEKVTTPASKKPVTTVKEPKAEKAKKAKGTPSKNPIIAFARYVKGAWQELRQVHWPTRRATWSMTGAVLVFSAIFAVLILLLDAGFQLLFEQILQ